MSEIAPYLPFLTRGLVVTLQVTAFAVLVTIAVAFVAGVGRMSKRWPVRLLAGLYIEVFRGTSVIVQLFWFFFVLPFLGLSLSPMTTGIVVLGLNGGAYGAEIVRGAIQSVLKGQWEAAIAVGMTPFRSLKAVILPQAIPAMIPPFGNLSIDLLKATSVVSLVTISDLTFRAQSVRFSTGGTTAVFAIVLVYYFVVALLFSLSSRWLERLMRIDRPTDGRPGWPRRVLWSAKRELSGT